ncbi:MAG: hypothetical protein RRA94_16580, partial [Bacteroidota bacterium]|nr:hypothetical protein [Bacteroidota bacterium]
MVTTRWNRDRVQAVPARALHVALALLFMAVASCSEGPIAPAPPGDFGSDRYLWPAQPGSLRYTRTAGGSSSTHELRFDGERITDVLLGSGETVLRTTVLTRRANGDGLELTGCDDSTALHLPLGLRFQDHIRTVEGPEVFAERWLTVDSRTLLAADGGALYRYGISDNQWVQETVPWQSDLRCLARDSAASPTVLFAGTAGDGIFRRQADENSWQKLPAPDGRVEDIAIDAGGVLFAVIDASLYVSRPPYDLWTPFTITQ